MEEPRALNSYAQVYTALDVTNAFSSVLFNS